jgi:hypothetical protein
LSEIYIDGVVLRPLTCFYGVKKSIPRKPVRR